ncbi:pyridoxal phosphate-dependent aminotransferase [[Clostridium] innocuum]|nr:pyridoxal phosphate-dependent aminotransferase [[Clostridium] innocuum]
MNYDFDTVLSRTGTGCVKWDKPFACSSDQKVLPLWVADMDFPCAQPIQQALHKRVDEQIYGYSCGFDEDYKSSVTGWFRRRFQWEIDTASIFYAGGVVPAIAYLLEILSEEGDGIVIQPPVYYPFRNKIEATKRCVVENPLINTNGTYTIDFEDLQHKLSETRVKGMILCSPHNPVGRVWTKEELRRVAELAHRYGKWIISDEIHCDLVRVGIQHTPLHTLVPEYRDEIIVCTAPSKSFNLAGLQNSNIILTNPKYQKRWRDFVINRLSLSTCNSFAITATKAAYNESEDWMDQVNAYIDGNICYASEFLKKELPQAVVSPCEGTYLLWVDVRAYCSDAQLLEQRMLKQSLILDEGYVFGAEGKGFERINMAAPRSLIKQCMQRFVKAVLDTSV